MSKLSRSPMRSLVLPATLMLAAAPAMAQIGDETVVTSNHAAGATTRTVTVSLAGLNLADGRDYRRLTHRIAVAADRVCSNNDLWMPLETIEYSRCRDAAVAGAMSHLPAAGAAID